MVAGRKAELRERDAYFRHPSLIVDCDLCVPNRVPRGIFPGVVVNDGVAQRARGSDLEMRARQVVMARIKINGEPIGIDIGVVAA